MPTIEFENDNERGLPEIITTLVGLFGSLAPMLLKLIENKKPKELNHDEIIRQVLTQDISDTDKIRLITAIMELK